MKKLAIIKRIFPYAKSDILVKFYRTYILPIIDYCCICFNTNILQDKNIENIQRKITKFICYKSKIDKTE